MARVGAGVHFVADGLAQPGTSAAYRTNGGATARVTRPEGDSGGVLVCDSTGRSIKGLIYQANGDPLDWDSTLSRHGRAARWSLRENPFKGKGSIVCEAGSETALWETVRAHSPIMLVPTQVTPGVPPRTVLVESASRKRLNDDLIEIEISWVEYQGVMFTGAVPAVTWGEVAAYSEGRGTPGWRAGSMEALAKAIQGMP
ncbi:hypothetical protein [Actinomyces bowdenii]|uniref:hypothetical protein n=1 Tax=Actinomyces bowdenii TaxID=131109 RepID=UPI00214BB915|nr:hypothetical protein [Actinomyces bowdenii]